MTRPRTMLVRDATIAGLAGYAATWVMEPVCQKLYEMESEQARNQEDEVRPGPPPEVAAEKTAALFGIELSEQQLKLGSLAFHHGLAISWALVYQVLRRKTQLGPVRAGLATGGDELGRQRDVRSRPRLHRAYPLVTHLRCVPAHLVFGLAVAGVAEAAWALVGSVPRHR